MPGDLRSLRRAAVPLVAVALIGVPVSGCGSNQSGELDSADAQSLLVALDEIRAGVAEGNCTVAGLDAEDLLLEIQSLPPSTDADLRRALENGAQNLTILLEDPASCDQAEQATTTTKSTTKPTTTQTTTAPTTTTTPTTPTTTPTGGGGGGGSGGGVTPP